MQLIATQWVANKSIVPTTTMSGSIKAAASYLKKPGTVEISADRKSLFWKPAGSTTATLTILTESIDSMPDTQYPCAVG